MEKKTKTNNEKTMIMAFPFHTLEKTTESSIKLVHNSTHSKL